LTAGSWGCASAAPAARAAAMQMRERLTQLVGTGPSKEPVHEALFRARRPFMEVEVVHAGLGQPPAALDRLKRGLPATVGPEYERFSAFSWIAHFAEVHVEPTTRRIRVPRVVSVCD